MPRIPAAVGALSVALAATVLLAPPARACSCDSLNLDDAVDRGLAVALVRSIDSHDRRTALAQVEKATSAAVPERIEIGEEVSCTWSLSLDEVGAIAVERRGDAWHMAHCSNISLWEGLRHVLGDPAVGAGGPPVAVVAGAFAGARLAALDRQGRVTAWDRLPGAGIALAVCPGGEVVAAVGRRGTDTLAEHDDGTELTLHDARTLRVVRTVQLGGAGYGYGTTVAGMACRSAGGGRVDLLTTSEGASKVPGRWTTVRGSAVSSRPLPGLRTAVATPGGFLATVEPRGPAVLVRLGADGSRRVLHRFSSERSVRAGQADYEDFRVAPGTIAVSRDGRTAAVTEFDRDSGFNALTSFDARTGKLMARQDLFDGDGFMGWTRAGRLMIRRGYSKAASVLELDRRLRPVAWRSAGTGEHMTVLGDDPVTYGRTRLTAYPALGGGQSRPARELRLAGALALAELPALGRQAFAPPEPTYPRIPPPVDPRPAGRPSTDRWTLPIGIGLAVVSLGLACHRPGRRPR